MRRKKITYDSEESKVVLGLLFLFLGITSFLSIFSVGSGTALSFITSLFGGATFFFGLFLTSIGLRLFRFKDDLITRRTVLGLLLATIAWSAFLTGSTGLPIDAKDAAYQGEYGGILGYETAEFIGDYFFRDLVQPLMFIIIFFSIPLIFSMSLPQYIKLLRDAIDWLKDRYEDLRNMISREEETDIQPASPLEIIDARTVGDFRKSEDSMQKVPEQPVKVDTSDSADADSKSKADQVKVQIKEKAGENDMVMQDELKYPNWKLPPLHLLHPYKKSKPSSANIKQNSQIIEKTLNSFGVDAQVVDVLIGPSVTQFALDIALGTKVSKIANLRNDLALALATSANAVRIEAPIPGTSFVGIEVPNKDREFVSFRELAEELDDTRGILPVTVGKKVSGEKLFADIQAMPHLLIAGATGSGKSVVTNSFIMSLLMLRSPDEVRFIMVDPKQVELSDYNGIPHLLTPVITNMDKVSNALKWAILEMERRYTEFKDSKVRNIEGYNKRMGFSALPYIVIVIDEMADMMMTNHGAEIEAAIVKLAQKARATGIHLILATQRPSVDVITGLIKANIPGRIGMSVTTQVDSRVILDQIGAESLLGRGDLLYKAPDRNRLERIQGNFVSQEEVSRVVNFIKEQSPEVEYSMEVTRAPLDPNAPEGAELSQEFSDDELFAQAARIVVAAQKGSASLIQRKLSVGYNRAARLLDELHEVGIVGPQKGSKPRDVLITDVDSFFQSQLAEEN